MLLRTAFVAACAIVASSTLLQVKPAAAEPQIIALDGLFNVELIGPLVTVNGQPQPQNPQAGQYAVRMRCIPGRCGATGVPLTDSGNRGRMNPDNYTYDLSTTVWTGVSSQYLPCDDTMSSNYSDVRSTFSIQPYNDGTFRGTLTQQF